MSKLSKFRVLIIFIDVIIFLALLFAKSKYYFVTRGTDWLFGTGTVDTIIMAIIVMIISYIISLSPSVIQGIFLYKNREKKSFIFALILYIINICWEGLSIIGATMSLDNKWFDTIGEMLSIHAIFILPLILNFIHNRLKRREVENGA